MASGRRELTWLACDALAATGRKPSIAGVREWTLANHGRKQGSDTDTQADINAWYAVLLAMKQEKQTVAGLPDDVAVLARGLWIRANEAAAESLAAYRAAIDDELAQASLVTQAALAAGTAADVRTAATRHELDVACEAIRRLEDNLSALRATIDATEVRHAGQLQGRDERLAALRQDSARKESEQAARVAELDGLRRHALLQIDEARTESRHWKSECERTAQVHQAALAAERQAGGKRQADLAGAIGRLSAIEESLASAQQRNAALEAALTQARASDVVARPMVAAKRPGTVKPSKTTAFRRRKL